MVTCFFGRGSPPVWVVQIFSTSDFIGDPRESAEGGLRWFPVSDIPYDEMWEDDRHWLPLVLDGKRFIGEFFYNEDGAHLIDVSIEIG